LGNMLPQKGRDMNILDESIKKKERFLRLFFYPLKLKYDRS